MNIKIGICQLKVLDDKQQNLTRALEMIKIVSKKGADLVVLPEMFNCPYQLGFFDRFAEMETGETVQLMAASARENHCYLVAGSIPERDGQGKIYNTSFIFDRQGRILTKHRKIHLFDVDIPGGICFKESAQLTPGNKVTSFKTEFGRFGVLICYDLRFPELFRLLVEDDVTLVIIPAAFNTTTGPAHWELLFKGRAVDNQIFMVGVSPARHFDAQYIAYGHSIAVNPWGEIIWQAGIDEIAEVISLDLNQVSQIRQNLPVLKHRRLDLYRVQKFSE